MAKRGVIKPRMLLKLLLHFTILIMILPRTKAASEVAQSLPGCPNKCGNVTISYPFGTRKGCYLSKSYKVNCASLEIFGTNIKLLELSASGLMRGLLPMAYECYNTTHLLSQSEPIIRLSRFRISSPMNIFTTVGCDTRADIMSLEGEDYIAGCVSGTRCDRLTKGECSSNGCRSVPVPYMPSMFRIRAQPNVGKVGKWKYNNCTYAFLVQRFQYMFHETDLDNLHNRSLPVAIEWTVGNTTCKEAQKNKTSYICKENSECYNGHQLGYLCGCASGYKGNAYLPNGCQDINECEGPKNDCVYGTYACANTNGSYNCSCPSGKSGDGKKHGTGCFYVISTKPQKNTLLIGISTGIAASVMLTLILYGALVQRRVTKSRDKFFKKNGGLILQPLLFESKQSSHKAKIFAARVLEKATDNFHRANVIGQGGFGTVYKGTLEDKTMVAVKKSKSIDKNQIEQFINEVIAQSEINHPNVVTLLGCCLETQTPLLVYEFVTNKTVFYHLHEKDHVSSMTFEKRLNIATQTAQALAHIHATTQIVHRDIKSSNILLADDYAAKVSDFGISRFIPIDETHVQTLVHGTLGYIDPEYFRSGILTEKSDVYSFGMVLIELLTGRKVFSHDGTESDLGLAMFFVSSLQSGVLMQIVDDIVKKDGLNENIKRVAELAKDCVELQGKKRPNMEEVKKKLEQIVLRIMSKGDYELVSLH